MHSVKMHQKVRTMFLALVWTFSCWAPLNRSHADCSSRYFHEIESLKWMSRPDQVASSVFAATLLTAGIGFFFIVPHFTSQHFKFKQLSKAYDLILAAHASQCFQWEVAATEKYYRFYEKLITIGGQGIEGYSSEQIAELLIAANERYLFCGGRDIPMNLKLYTYRQIRSQVLDGTLLRILDAPPPYFQNDTDLSPAYEFNPGACLGPECESPTLGVGFNETLQF